MESTIKIRAEVLSHDAQTCKFVVDRPVFPGAWVRFRSKEQAAGSPLAEKLFALPNVSNVILNDAEVLVTYEGEVNWRAVGPQIGSAIRTQIESGIPAASEEATKAAPVEDVLRQKVQRILDHEINPAIASHNGYITLLDVRGNDVFIQMGGGCQGCSGADITLRQGVETSLREQIPEIGQILDITDHASGENPYYSQR